MKENATIEIDVIIQIDGYTPAQKQTRDHPHEHEEIDYTVYVTNSDNESVFLQDELIVKNESYLTERAFELAHDELEARSIEQSEFEYEAQKEEGR